MKKLAYLGKAFAFFLVVVPFFESCSSDFSSPCTALTTDEKVNDTIKLKYAQQNINHYASWWRIVPDSMLFNKEDSTLTFTKKKIKDPRTIKAFIAYQKGHENRKAPFYDEQGPAYGHLIYTREIAKALNIEKFCSSDFAGIRVYMGTELPTDINFDKHPEEFLKHTQTKLYFTPVVEKGGEYNDFINEASGVKYVYDLTLPCPKSCDEASPLYQAIAPQ